eukprot:comp24223_c2_seq1/m.44633 comp24223_c2_seq1/g.44633  ORF comp24223_c2_seq1/g.44633 comp24223_c2_seq1/m.44633 type:complete len:136 (-) comp24223_c2_seq1:114-521(-)
MVGMLSENQLNSLVARANEKINIPFRSEEKEARMLWDIAEPINEHLEPALRSFLPADYVNALKIALNENLPLAEKHKRITAILQKNLTEPLADALNKRVNIPLFTEKLEDKMMEMVCDEIIEELVEHTIKEKKKT